MAFILPTFNISVNIWRYATWGAVPPVVIPVPDVVVNANLTPGKRWNWSFGFYMMLLLPIATDIRDGEKENLGFADGDIVEAPAASGRYYKVQTVDDIAKNFPNEHRFAVCFASISSAPELIPWPVPYP